MIMKINLVLLCYTLLQFLEVINANLSCPSCHAFKMKMLLDSTLNIIKNASNLTEELEQSSETDFLEFTNTSPTAQQERSTLLDRYRKKRESDYGYHNTGMENMDKEEIDSWEFKPIDCEGIMNLGYSESGVYTIQPQSRSSEIQVACDMDTDGGGWTVIQRRGDFGSPKNYFYKNWWEYKSGFGLISQDFWLGNDNIFALTNQKAYTLRIDMMDLENEKRYAVYNNFWIDGEDNNYSLHVNGYSGTAGDSLTFHNNFKFTTKDRDNDNKQNINCAVHYKGAWWYNNCLLSNLNGLYLYGRHTTYADGIEWHAWKGYRYSLPFVEMKIRSPTFHLHTDSSLEAESIR